MNHSQDTVHPNIALIQQFFSYYAAHDLAGIRSVMAEDVEWHISGRHPLSGTKRGVQEVLAFFALLQKANFQAQVHFLEANDDFVVDVHRGWGTFEGQTIDMNWVLFYQFKDGKIAKVQNFAGDQVAADTFFWHVYRLKPLPDRLLV